MHIVDLKDSSPIPGELKFEESVVSEFVRLHLPPSALKNLESGGGFDWM